MHAWAGGGWLLIAAGSCWGGQGISSWAPAGSGDWESRRAADRAPADAGETTDAPGRSGAGAEPQVRVPEGPGAEALDAPEAARGNGDLAAAVPGYNAAAGSPEPRVRAYARYRLCGILAALSLAEDAAGRAADLLADVDASRGDWEAELRGALLWSAPIWFAAAFDGDAAAGRLIRAAGGDDEADFMLRRLVEVLAADPERQAEAAAVRERLRSR
jgi:hypothetical protein